LINPAIIQGVLYYHIVAGQQLSSALTSGASFNTLYTDLTTNTAQAIVINSDGTLKTGSSNQSIHITVPDQKATNGVFHITESVLIPPSVGATLTPILGTVAGTILLGADFTDVAQIVAAADHNYVEAPASGAFKISTWLAMPINAPAKTTANAQGITFFAIPNAVFKAAAAAAGGGTTEAQIVASFTASSDVARGLLLNHLAPATTTTSEGQYTVAAAPGTNPNNIIQFTNAQSITAKGKAITVTVTTPGTTTGPYGVVLTNTTPKSAPIVSKDVIVSNGVIQVIGGILQ
jgi:uncharacterized surface protein with fasciclin (FAS1) repeats